MKTSPTTLRRRPAKSPKASKAKPGANHRSANGEILGKDAAAILRRFEKITTAEERLTMADAIESIRQRMKREHLH